MAVAQETDVLLLAKTFRGFSDPTRLALVVALLEGEQRVTDLVERVGGSQANVSQHLSCLRECGIVEARPQGRQVFYRLTAEDVVDLLTAGQRVLARNGQAIDVCGNYARLEA